MENQFRFWNVVLLNIIFLVKMIFEKKHTIFIFLFIALMVLRAIAASTEAVNWDEYALLSRATRTLLEGVLIGDGRPGLVTLILTPFVKGCLDSTQAVVNARYLWIGFSVAYVGGVYAMTFRFLKRCGKYDVAAPVAVAVSAMLGFAPVFIDWSIQVRTDQVALAFAAWAGWFAMGRERWSSLVSGCFAVASILSSQKGVYLLLIGAWCATITVFAQVAVHNNAPKKVLITAGVHLLSFLGGAVLALMAFVALAPDGTWSRITSKSGVDTNLSSMADYAQMLGYRAYVAEMYRMPALVLSLLGSVWMIWRGLRGAVAEKLLAIASMGLIVLGVAVAVFHGSRFAYFLMTALAFFSMAAALAAVAGLQQSWVRTYSTVVLASSLVFAVPAQWRQLRDTQATQRDVTAAIASSTLRDASGWSIEGAAFCSGQRRLFPAMFNPGILSRLNRGGSGFDDLIEYLRSEPVSYIIGSFRIAGLGEKFRGFIFSHYVPYRKGLFVTGFTIGSIGDVALMDILVEGRYRWIPRNPRDGHAKLSVDGQSLSPGQEITLTSGQHEVSAEGSTGVLVLSVDIQPDWKAGNFYDFEQAKRMSGQ